MAPKVSIILAVMLSAVILAGEPSRGAIIAGDSFRGEPKDLSEFFSMPIRHAFIARMEFECVTKRMVEEILFGKPAPAPILSPVPARQRSNLRTVVHRTIGGSRSYTTIFLTEPMSASGLDIQVHDSFVYPKRMKTFNQVIQVDDGKEVKKPAPVKP